LEEFVLVKIYSDESKTKKVHVLDCEVETLFVAAFGSVQVLAIFAKMNMLVRALPSTHSICSSFFFMVCF